MLARMPARRSRAFPTTRPRRAVQLAFCGLLVVPAAGCKPKPTTNVTVADGDAEPAGGAPGSKGNQVPPRASDRGPIEKIQVSASIFGLGDMLDAAGTLINMWSPPEPGATPIDLRNLIAVTLVQEGFGPGFFESLNLDGVHAGQVGFPHDGQPGVTERDIDVALSFAAINPTRMIDSMPAALQPQPLGDGVYQIVQDDMQLLFRAGQSALEIGLNMQSLDLARSLPAKVDSGPNAPRIHVVASNIPSVDIDVSELIPLPPALARTLSEIINEAKAIELAADFGSDRDLIASLGAEAPFGRLGLEPIGPATQAPSDLAKALPTHALFAWVMPWGNPRLLHQVIDKQIPVNQIPAPFDSYVGEVLAGSHAILDTIKDEVIAATYVEKGKLTLLLGAEVKDEAAAREAMRKVMTAAEKAFQDHIALAGNSPDHKYTVSFKQSVVKVGKGKGDLFTLTIPKDKQADLKDAAWFVGDKNPQIEVATVVVDGKLFLAIGAGQQDLMKLIGKGGADLESGGGLALARKLAGGCQYCVSIDPVEIGELIFTVLGSDQDEPEQVRKAAAEANKKLAKLGLTGELALALRLEDRQGTLGFGWPKSLLFAEPAKIKTVLELFESIDSAREKAWEAEAPSTRPQ
jgi:hypothetical protein